MNATKNIPKKAGYYWWQDAMMEKPIIVQVREGFNRLVADKMITNGSETSFAIEEEPILEEKWQKIEQPFFDFDQEKWDNYLDELGILIKD